MISRSVQDLLALTEDGAVDASPLDLSETKARLDRSARSRRAVRLALLEELDRNTRFGTSETVVRVPAEAVTIIEPMGIARSAVDGSVSGSDGSGSWVSASWRPRRQRAIALGPVRPSQQESPDVAGLDLRAEGGPATITLSAITVSEMQLAGELLDDYDRIEFARLRQETALSQRDTLLSRDGAAHDPYPLTSPEFRFG